MASILHKLACFVLRPPVTRWPPGRGAWWARARRWVIHILLRYNSETCDRCGGRVEVAWMASDECWRETYAAATGHDRGSGGLLCLLCFDAAAFKIGKPVLWCAFDIQDVGVVAKTAGALRIPDPVQAPED